ncbi:peptide-binding protein, partial [Streptomyces albidoflavus]
MEQGQRWWGPVGRGTEPPPPPPSPSPPRPRGNRRPKTPPGP